MPQPRLSHIGLCVADADRAQRFYEEGLGFSHSHDLEIKGEPTATLLRLPDVELRAIYLKHGETVLELLHYPTPGVVKGDAPRPLNRLGLTHLSFLVEDLDATLARLESLGGQLLPETRIEPGGGVAAVFLTDPDGTLVELVRQPQS